MDHIHLMTEMKAFSLYIHSGLFSSKGTVIQLDIQYFFNLKCALSV